MLGEGGMGEVYLALDQNTDRKVAIKVVAPELMRDEGVRRRFLEEARVMASLEHPSIVTLLAFFEEGGRFFLVMQFVDGESLEERIERQGPLSFDEAERVHGAVRSALDYGHSRPQPVIHRDIKPANILLGKDGSVVVTDFGVAKALGREKMTRTRGVVGTYEYMSPEQVQGEEVTAASDLYALGITLYKMLTGVVPFPQTSETGLECMNAHVAGVATSVSEYREGIPAQVGEAVARYLEKDPAQRVLIPVPVVEASVVAGSLPVDEVIPEPIEDVEDSPNAGRQSPSDRPNWEFLGCVAFLLIAVIVVVVVLVLQKKSETPAETTKGVAAATSSRSSDRRQQANEGPREVEGGRAERESESGSGIDLSSYESGAPKSKTNLATGEITHWWENGQAKMKGRLVAGAPDGAWTLWYEGGEKAGELTYRNGLPHGRWRIWHANGQVKAEQHWDFGLEHGVWKEWHENGFLDTKETHEYGDKLGAWEKWWDNGQQRSSGVCGEDEKTNSPCLDKVGNEAECDFMDMNWCRFVSLGFSEEMLPPHVEHPREHLEGMPLECGDGLELLGEGPGNGQHWCEQNAVPQGVHKGWRGGHLSFRFGYKDGEPDGQWTSWHENGVKEWEEENVDGEKLGPFKWWYHDGSRRAEGHCYPDGTKEGSPTCWNREGSVEECSGLIADWCEVRTGPAWERLRHSSCGEAAGSWKGSFEAGGVVYAAAGVIEDRPQERCRAVFSVKFVHPFGEIECQVVEQFNVVRLGVEKGSPLAAAFDLSGLQVTSDSECHKSYSPDNFQVGLSGDLRVMEGTGDDSQGASSTVRFERVAAGNGRKGDETPLTRYPLEEYTFIMLMTGTSDPEALVKNPDGVLHVVHVNDRLGSEGGHIEAILKESVLVRIPDLSSPVEVSLVPSRLPNSHSTE